MAWWWRVNVDFLAQDSKVWHLVPSDSMTNYSGLDQTICKDLSPPLKLHLYLLLTVKLQEDLLATSCKMRPTGWEKRGTCAQMWMRARAYARALTVTRTTTPPSISSECTRIVPLHRGIVLEKLQGVSRPRNGDWEVRWLGKTEKMSSFLHWKCNKFSIRLFNPKPVSKQTEFCIQHIKAFIPMSADSAIETV